LSATLDAAGNVQTSGDADVTSGCGLSAATADIRRPASSYDGKKVAFAARSSASEPFSVYEMDATGANCAKHAGINAVTGTSNGLPVHNFDPQYGPADANGVEPILFISTRGIDPNANGMEPEIAAGMQRLEKELHDAQQAMGAAPAQGNDSQQGLETALNRVERLRNQLGSLSRDGQGRQQGGRGQGGGQQGNQQSGNQGAWSPNGGPGARIGGDNGTGYVNTYPGGGSTGTLYGNLDTGNNTPRGGSPIQPDTSPIPPQRAYEESLRDLNQLRQTVREDPEMAKQVQELIQEMERLDPSRFPGNPALVEQLHSQVLADVDKLELQLRRQLDDKDAGQVRSGDTKSVPQGYEEPVAEYYRRLSKNSK